LAPVIAEYGAVSGKRTGRRDQKNSKNKRRKKH